MGIPHFNNRDSEIMKETKLVSGSEGDGCSKKGKYKLLNEFSIAATENYRFPILS
jgi:hypothetical protein